MSRQDVSPAYTQEGRRDGIGRIPDGIVPAFFREVDGQLLVETDSSLATHSWELFNGRRIIVPYRADSTMMLGNALTLLGALRVPISSLLLSYTPEEVWAEFVPVSSRASSGCFTEALDDEEFIGSFSDYVHSRTAAATYTESV